MGVDLARKMKAAYKKALDQHLLDLAKGNLFSRAIPPGVVHSAAGDVARGTVLVVGEEMVVQCVGDRVAGLRGIDQVTCFEAPDPAWADPLRAGGALKGVVTAVHDLGAGMAVAEVRLCSP